MNASDLKEFLSEFPDELLDRVCDEIDGAENTKDFSDAESQRVAEYINEKTAASQEIGPLPAVADPVRREDCRTNNLLFAETYFGPTFYLPWAPYQREMMARFESVILEGGRECHAVRRGGLKSTCARVSALWAAVNGHRRFPVLVGATDDKSAEHRENLLAMLCSSPLLLADFPELIPLLKKVKQPKKQYRLDGRLLTLHPKDARGRIVFPDIYDAPSCETHIAPYSINATDVSGLSFVDRFGVTIRPDLLVFDDVQTPQSAGSPMMTDEREDAVTKTFIGLAGLGEKIAAIMVCTVRKSEDLSERFLNRKRHPDWFGKKYPSVIRFPDRMDLWEANAARLGMGSTPEEGSRLSVEHYMANRLEMDAGGKVAWEYDKLPEEPSALYSLMTIRAINPAFFLSEIQQEGIQQINTSGLRLDTQSLSARLSNVERGVMPSQTSFLVAFVDSSDSVLWWMVCAFAPDFSGAIVDYGTWPDQKRSMFYKTDIPYRLDIKDLSWEESFAVAHNSLDDFLMAKYPRLDLILKDWSDGEHMPRIKSQVLSSKHRKIIKPSKGFSPKPGRKMVHQWGDQKKDRHTSSHWIERRTETPNHIQFNANIWKTFAARRLKTAPGAPSAVLMPGTSERENRLLCEHFTAESPVEMMHDGATGIAWEELPGRDNDWWDCFVGCCVAASVLGVTLPTEKIEKKEQRTFTLPGGARGR